MDFVFASFGALVEVEGVGEVMDVGGVVLEEGVPVLISPVFACCYFLAVKVESFLPFGFGH